MMCLLASGTSHAAAETIVAALPAVPATIRIGRELQPSINAMLKQSPTFRQQFERVVTAPQLILEAGVNVMVLQQPTIRARSSIRRYDSGLLVVSMAISPNAVQPEWIAHEFEHVIEQLDGLSLPGMVSPQRTSVWYSIADMIETRRAIMAGRAVRDEMHAHRGLSDKFVE